MRRPKKISPDPIIEAVAEFRFDAQVPPDAVLGMFFNVVKDKFPEFTKLPIAQFPDELRAANPQLRFAPFYQATASPFQLNIGPNVLSVVNSGKYVGWDDEFFPFLKDIVSKLENSGVVRNYLRIGLRYINFFENDIFDNITLAITQNSEPLKSIQTNLSTIFESESSLTRVLIQNNTTVNLGNKQGKGSIIDTDTCHEPKDGIPSDKIIETVSKVHDDSLSIFFSLLKKEFIKTLNPEY
jgi:uncharacterized protein (TIGR04255 family)